MDGRMEHSMDASNDAGCIFGKSNRHRVVHFLDDVAGGWSESLGPLSLLHGDDDDDEQLDSSASKPDSRKHH